LNPPPPILPGFPVKLAHHDRLETSPEIGQKQPAASTATEQSSRDVQALNSTLKSAFYTTPHVAGEEITNFNKILQLYNTTLTGAAASG